MIAENVCICSPLQKPCCNQRCDAKTCQATLISATLHCPLHPSGQAKHWMRWAAWRLHLHYGSSACFHRRLGDALRYTLPSCTFQQTGPGLDAGFRHRASACIVEAVHAFTGNIATHCAASFQLSVSTDRPSTGCAVPPGDFTCIVEAVHASTSDVATRLSRATLGSVVLRCTFEPNIQQTCLVLDAPCSQTAFKAAVSSFFDNYGSHRGHERPERCRTSSAPGRCSHA
jgi:hypothetical protein